MKRLIIILGVMMLASVLLVTVSCAETPAPSQSHPTPVPPMGVPPGTPGAAADDIVTPPGGFTYRANVHQEGQPDWPPIQQTEVSLKSLFRTVSIKYRDYIETKAGETRNNIIYLEVSGFPPLDPLKVSYEAVSVPEGINVERDWQTYGGIGSQNKKSSKTLLKIHIASQLAPGEYPFAIKVADFGSIPCTVKVVD
jgi:hypothetical protein